MITLTKIQIAIVLLFALGAGGVGATAVAMYRRHNQQHYLADTDHKLLEQLTPIVNQLVQIEQQRQQAARLPQ